MKDGSRKLVHFSACSARGRSTFSGLVQFTKLMKTSLVTFITALATVAFLSSCAKKEEPMAASSTATTHGTSTTKKTTAKSSTKKTSTASAEASASPAAKKSTKKAAAEASPSASESASPSPTP
jgi:hypothetical protein